MGRLGSSAVRLCFLSLPINANAQLVCMTYLQKSPQMTGSSFFTLTNNINLRCSIGPHAPITRIGSDYTYVLSWAVKRETQRRNMPNIVQFRL